MQLAELLARLEGLTTLLAQKYEQRGDLIAEKIKAVNAAWDHMSDRAVTDRRETSKQAGSQFDALLAKDDGEIQALEVERQYVLVMIDVVKAGLLP